MGGGPAFRTLVIMAASGRMTPAGHRTLAYLAEAARAPWPLPNVILGVSAGNDHSARIRLPVLRATPAAARFVSAEPLIGPSPQTLPGSPG